MQVCKLTIRYQEPYQQYDTVRRIVSRKKPQSAHNQNFKQNDPHFQKDCLREEEKRKDLHD